ncbi:MAG: VWA domain-containing protein [Acidimicrobiia bacterium]|nr:VWA domain-containing protein [Acidimicrobiia bacterium]
MSTRLRFAAALGLVSALVGVAVGVTAESQARQGQPAQGQPAQDDVIGETPRFQAQVEYVEVDVLVTDAQGRLVRDLTKDDFQVFEDGKSQTIANFSMVNIPLERADRPLFRPDPVEPDTASNERPFNGRLYVAILDDLHTNALRSQLVKNAAKQFIQRNLSANDLMAIVYTGGRSDWSQEFTNNRRLLMNSVDRFIGSKLQSATLNKSQEYFRQRDLAFNDNLNSRTIADPEDAERAFKARNTLATIKNVADWFGGIRGRRKTMLLFSEGIDYDITDIIRGYDQRASQASNVLEDVRDAVAAATRANVSIYAIDPRGLTDMGDDTIAVGSLGNQDNPGNGLGLSGLRNEQVMAQMNLRTLSDETGGFATVNTNQFANAFQRIVEENSAYYVIAYYPLSNKRDGRFHRIEVKTKRPGLTIRSRKGYQAPRGKAPTPPAGGKTSAELAEAMASPIPVGGLGMRVFAAPFKGTAPNASILLGVELIGRMLSLAENGRIEITYAAVDTQGKTKAGSTDHLTTNLRPDTRTRVQQTGFRMLNRFDLQPGKYHLRVAARDAAGGVAGSVTYDLEVPDFAKQALGLSGILITSMSGSAMVTAKNDEQVKGVLPAAPIASRDFPQNDELALFAEVYDNQTGPAHRVDITTTIQTDEGRVVFKAEDERNSSELQGAKGGYGYAVRIPLNDLAPGAYVLHLQAKSRLGNDVGVGRQIRIRVTPPVRPAL